jgi:hypothetical protein
VLPLGAQQGVRDAAFFRGFSVRLENNRDEHHSFALDGAVTCIHQRGVHLVGSLLLSGVVLSAPAIRGGFVFDARSGTRLGAGNRNLPAPRRKSP